MYVEDRGIQCMDVIESGNDLIVLWDIYENFTFCFELLFVALIYEFYTALSDF